MFINLLDFKKTFDMIDRSTMWRIMRHYGIPLKSVSIIRSLYDGMTCQVIQNKDLSSPFTVTTGVRQGCLLSPMIFSLVVDWLLNPTMDQPRGLQWNFANTLEILDFADDSALLSNYCEHIQNTGLEIKTQQTKIMRVNTVTNTLI